jgi:hypothetical protein
MDHGKDRAFHSLFPQVPCLVDPLVAGSNPSLGILASASIGTTDGPAGSELSRSLSIQADMTDASR